MPTESVANDKSKVMQKGKRFLVALVSVLIVVFLVVLACHKCTREGEEAEVPVKTPENVEDTVIVSVGPGSDSLVVMPIVKERTDSIPSFQDLEPIDSLPKVIRLSVSGVTFDMVLVHAGSFTMGAKEDKNANQDEYPNHRVRLTRDYYLAATEVTQALFEAVMGYNPSGNNHGGNYPVVQVSYNDAVAFCSRLTSMVGRQFRLPTEAEWEFAAQGVSGTENIDEEAWFFGNSDNNPHPVAKKKPNALGLYDMLGNVWEWCSDWYGDYSSGENKDPVGPSSGDLRVLRGGSWYYFAEYCRITNRNGRIPTYRSDNVGFRVVME